MAIEAKELLKAFGLPEDTASVEDAVKTHGQKFVSRTDAAEDEEIFKNINGKVLSGAMAEARRVFDFKSADIKDKNLGEVLKMGVEKMKSRITELEESAGQNNDEAIGKLKKTIETLNTQVAQYKGDLETTAKALEDEKATADTKIRGFKTKTAFDAAFSKLPWSDTANDISKEGLDTRFNKKYNLEIDDNDNISITDKAGKKINNPSKAGQYLTMEEVLTAEAKEANLLKQNNQRGGEPYRFNNQNGNAGDGGRGNGGNGNGNNGRQLNPKAQQNAENMADAVKQ